MSENNFKTEDVLAVVREVASHSQPFREDNQNGYDYVLCDYCNGKYIDVYRSEQEARDKFKHELNCVWLIAKDMLTGHGKE
jgi:hypothetical protein